MKGERIGSEIRHAWRYNHRCGGGSCGGCYRWCCWSHRNMTIAKHFRIRGLERWCQMRSDQTVIQFFVVVCCCLFCFMFLFLYCFFLCVCVCGMEIMENTYWPSELQNQQQAILFALLLPGPSSIMFAHVPNTNNHTNNLTTAIAGYHLSNFTPT